MRGMHAKYTLNTVYKRCEFCLCFRQGGGDRDSFTHGWWQRFLKRHPDLRLRTPNLLDPGRALMSKSTVMNKFFSDIQVFLSDNGLLDQPSRIYNIDETWDNPTQEKHQKVVVDKDMKIAY